MAVGRIIRVSLLVAVAHFVLTSLIGYYAAYKVGAAAGGSIARLLIDASESGGAIADQTIEERLRAIKGTAARDAALWQPVTVLVSIPIRFALEPVFKPLTRSWYDRALAHELSLSQWKIRMHALILFKALLNSACLGFLVYLGLRIARNSHTQ